MWPAKLTLILGAPVLLAAADTVAAPETGASQGQYRLPYEDGTTVKVFDDFTSHRPVGRVDLFAVAGARPYKVLAAADGVVKAIQNGFSEQLSGRAAKDCHNNYVWIAHANGEWSNYSHVAHGSVAAAGLRVGDRVKAGQVIGIEGAVGCAMLDHVHFEIAVPSSVAPLDANGFLTDNDGGRRERNPRFCGLGDHPAVKGQTYTARPCG
ncbi:M23 family metallopeptidase [Sphingomonas alpina]|uniref:M23 family metallopeptidase n=1 Tax=Sphingomonas alpina TaxID=653931 RepID=A0A7H0LER2_9SPHN|nr:M23 family metallopeptidase [Sphingomonas alpina]QNQ08165.1 M23 family metallopeptidase [Sphingomonas alpina]